MISRNFYSVLCNVLPIRLALGQLLCAGLFPTCGHFEIFGGQTHFMPVEDYDFQGPADDALYIGVRGAVEDAALHNGAGIELLADAAELHFQQLADLRGSGWFEVEDFLKASPDGGVQQAFVVGGGDD